MVDWQGAYILAGGVMGLTSIVLTIRKDMGMIRRALARWDAVESEEAFLARLKEQHQVWNPERIQ